MKTKIAISTILFFLTSCLSSAVPVKAEANLAVTSPSAGQIWVAGSTKIITWNSSTSPVIAYGQVAPTVYIDLNMASSCPASTPASCGGTTNAPYVIAENAPNTGSYYWTIPNTLALSYQGPVTVTVDLSDSSAMGTSGQFYIVAPTSYLSPTPIITPNGGEQWAIGGNQTISWSNASSTSTNVSINLIPLNSGCSIASSSPCTEAAATTYYQIASNLPNSGSYLWDINNSITGQPIPPGSYAISVTDAGSGNVLGSSAAAFTLTGQTSGSSSATSTYSLPNISGINPSSGAVGQLVNVIGSNFTPTGNTVQFGQSTYIGNLNSSNGSALQFTVPAYTQPCPPNNNIACPLAMLLITPGAYGISVTNASGTSNTVPFEVTGSSTNPVLYPINPPTSPLAPIAFPNGSLLMASGNPTVYLVNSGELMPFTNAQIFLAYGYTWAQIQTISQSQLNPEDVSASPVLAPNGSIIKSQDNPTVYLVVNGQKSAIPSVAVFNSLGLNFNNLITLSDQELQKYPSAPMQQ